jgi:hypothetical protein
MANTKISAMTAAAALDGTELVPVVQGGGNVKATTQDIADLAGGGGLVDQTLASSVTVTMPGESVKFAGTRTSGTVTATSNCWINFDGDADAGYDEFYFNSVIVDSAGAGQAATAGIDVYTGIDGDPSSANVVLGASGVTGTVQSSGSLQLMKDAQNFTSTYTDSGTPANNHSADLEVGASATRAYVQVTGDLVLKNGVFATQAAAPTLTSGATIAPTRQISFVSGTTDIVNITAPTEFATGGGFITLIPTGLWHTTNAGNIAIATTAVVSKALIMTYDHTSAKWYPSY